MYILHENEKGLKLLSNKEEKSQNCSNRREGERKEKSIEKLHSSKHLLSSELGLS